jgi:FtsH-binding integral membrane protein
MGLVAVTIGLLALGAYVGRDLYAGFGIVFFIGALACIFALNIASPRDSRQLATTLPIGVGLLLGLALGPVLSAYAKADSSALWQAAGATAAFFGALGYALRRDLTPWAHTLFWALVALIVFAIVAIFASIPHANLIYAVAGLAIFGGFTMFDFNRMLRTGTEGAVPTRQASSSTSSTCSCCCCSCSAASANNTTVTTGIWTDTARKQRRP